MIQGADEQSASFIMPDFSIESALSGEGYRLIAGVDEAGRGALAGPLAVGMTIYDVSLFTSPPEDIITRIRDSKKLSPTRRLRALETIARYSLFSHAEMVSHRAIDENNIIQAINMALKKLVNTSPLRPDIILMDGTIIFDVGIPMIPVKKGDNRSFSIASASIEAKVRRDLVMDRFDLRHPGFGFARNKGYGTAEHRHAIEKNGPCAIHRRSYEPLRSLMENNKGLFEP